MFYVYAKCIYTYMYIHVDCVYATICSTVINVYGYNFRSLRKKISFNLFFFLNRLGKVENT